MEPIEEHSPMSANNSIIPNFSAQSEPTIGSSSMFDFKTIVIIVLGGLLLITILGVNSAIVNLFSDIFAVILKLLGYTTGAAISTVGKGVEIVGRGVEVVGDGVERVGKSVDNVGDHITDKVDNDDDKDDNKDNEPELDDTSFADDVTFPSSGRKIDEVVGRRRGEYQPGPMKNDPMGSDTGISTGKQRWCLAGTFRGSRGCVAINDNRLCSSGKLFPSKSECMKPKHE